MQKLNLALEQICIYDLFVHFEFPLPPGAAPDKSFVTHSPFRKDKHPSFSVYKWGDRWFYKDLSPAFEQYKGNALTFFRLASGITDKKLSTEEFCKLAGIGKEAVGIAHRAPVSKRVPPVSCPHPKPILKMRSPSCFELDLISQQRGGLSVSALREAVRRGYLRIGKLCGFTSWVITDSSGRMIQGRRADHVLPRRYPIPRFNDPKSMNVKNSDPRWPLGLDDTKDRPNAVLVEGGPDFLAAFHWLERERLLDSVQPVAFLGGENNFTTETAMVLRGKKVMVFPHADLAGDKASAQWQKALRDAGVTQLKIMDFRRIATLCKIPKRIKDLNELVPYQRSVPLGKLFAFFATPLIAPPVPSNLSRPSQPTSSSSDHAEKNRIPFES